MRQAPYAVAVDAGVDERPVPESIELPGEVELAPGGPPVGGPRGDRATIDDLDSRQEAVLLEVIRGNELHPDFHRRRWHVRRDGVETRERGGGTLFDHLPGANRWHVAGAVPSERGLHRDRGQALSEQGT